MIRIIMRLKDFYEGDVTKGPWDAKRKPADAAPAGYGNMIDMSTGQKVNKPIDPSNMTPVSLSSVFASSGYNVVKDMGYNFCEKPSYFSDLNDPKFQIPKQNIAAIQRKLGYNLETYYLEDILVPKCDRRGNCEYYPMSDADLVHNDEPHNGGPGVRETTFIVKASEDDPSRHPAYKAGDMFLCDRTGARRYIRMWAKLV